MLYDIHAMGCLLWRGFPPPPPLLAPVWFGGDGAEMVLADGVAALGYWLRLVLGFSEATSSNPFRPVQ
jgi:hypothetical protein